MKSTEKSRTMSGTGMTNVKDFRDAQVQPQIQVLYFVPEDGETSKSLNAFSITLESSLQPITLRTLRANFPLPGNYHFRLKQKFKDSYVWLDLTDDSDSLPVDGSNIIILKINRIQERKDHATFVGEKFVPNLSTSKNDNLGNDRANYFAMNKEEKVDGVYNNYHAEQSQVHEIGIVEIGLGFDDVPGKNSHDLNSLSHTFDKKNADVNNNSNQNDLAHMRSVEKPKATIKRTNSKILKKSLSAGRFDNEAIKSSHDLLGFEFSLSVDNATTHTASPINKNKLKDGLLDFDWEDNHGEDNIVDDSLELLNPGSSPLTRKPVVDDIPALPYFSTPTNIPSMKGFNVSQSVKVGSEVKPRNVRQEQQFISSSASAVQRRVANVAGEHKMLHKASSSEEGLTKRTAMLHDDISLKSMADNFVL